MLIQCTVILYKRLNTNSKTRKLVTMNKKPAKPITILSILKSLSSFDDDRCVPATEYPNELNPEQQALTTTTYPLKDIPPLILGGTVADQHEAAQHCEE